MIGDNTPTQKEACLMFYLVKGHLNTSLETIYSSYTGYFKRLWIDGSNGAPLYEYEEGFEEAYKKMLDKQANL
tara:strand:+ start:2955 stop:3173 length:219 start_codon:yes stop_codon:yes gene_type:complete